MTGARYHCGDAFEATQLLSDITLKIPLSSCEILVYLQLPHTY